MAGIRKLNIRSKEIRFYYISQWMMRQGGPDWAMLAKRDTVFEIAQYWHNVIRPEAKKSDSFILGVNIITNDTGNNPGISARRLATWSGKEIGTINFVALK